MELPAFEQIVKENQSDVDILTVNLLGAEQSKHAVAQFVKDRKFTFPIVLDEHGEMMKKYQIITIPTTFSSMKRVKWSKPCRSADEKQIKEWTNS